MSTENFFYDIYIFTIFCFIFDSANLFELEADILSVTFLN